MIPGFTIERTLGAGAHGKVYLAREEGGLARPVALKVFERREEFERELEMTRKVEEIRRRERIAEIVQSLGSGEHSGLSYIVLEYLESGSLADLVAREGPVSCERALGFVREAARALGALHREGIFHRDVKPQNLLLGQDGHVRLGDFGLSRSLEGTLSAAGSPAFAAPEVIAGRLEDGKRADIYSLGATLAYLLTGETILPGRPDVFALERRGVPRPVQRAIVTACAAERLERPESVELFDASLDTKKEENPRTKSAPADGRAEGLDMQTNYAARPVSPPHLMKRAVASLLCALAVWPAGLTVVALFVFGARSSEAPTVHMIDGDTPPPAEPGASVLPFVIFAVCAAIPLILEVLAFVFGIGARSKISRSQGALTGSGWALAGIIVASLNLLPLCLAVPASVLFARFDSAKGARRDLVTKEQATARNRLLRKGLHGADPFRRAKDGGWSVFAVNRGGKTSAVELWYWDEGPDPTHARIRIDEARGSNVTHHRATLVSVDDDLQEILTLLLGRDRIGGNMGLSLSFGSAELEGRSIACELVSVHEQRDGERIEWEILVPKEPLGMGMAGLTLDENGERTVRTLRGYGVSDANGDDRATAGETFAQARASVFAK